MIGHSVNKLIVWGILISNVLTAPGGAEPAKVDRTGDVEVSQAQPEQLNQWTRNYARAVEYFQAHKLKIAQKYFTRALKAIRDYKPGTDKEITTLARLADISLQLNRCKEAENYYAAILRIHSARKNKKLEADTIDWLDALSYSFLSYNISGGDLDADRAKRERFLVNSLKLKSLARSDKNVIEILRALTVHYNSVRNFKEAEKYALRLVKRDQHKNGYETVNVAMELFTLASIKESLLKFDQAESCYRQSIAILLPKEVTDPTVIPNIRGSLARCLLKAGQDKLAEKEARTTLLELEKFSGPERLFEVQARRVLANLAIKKGDYKEAIKQEKAVVSVIDRLRGTNNPMYLEDLKTLVKVYKKLGRSREAKQLSEKVAYIETLIQK